ncbi:MAG: response regulator [Pirellulaceae bacterium]|nr:response regulator [Pirellulaceae bacterium]
MVAATQRILVVDDEEIVRESYRLVLADAGYDVRTVSNGREALEVCRAEHFDVVLADIRMPDMDGLEMSREVVRDFPGTRVIVITGYPSPESAERARRLGVSDYLQKPVPPDQLTAVTAAALARPLPVRCEESETPAAAPSTAQTGPAVGGEMGASAASAGSATAAGRVAAALQAGQDISPFTAFLVLLGSPLVGLAYFLLFPFVASVIAIAVIVKEVARLVRPASS